MCSHVSLCARSHMDDPPRKLNHVTPDVVDLTGECVQNCCESTAQRSRAPVISSTPSPAPVFQVLHTLNNHGTVHISHNKFTKTAILGEHKHHKQEAPKISTKYVLKTCYDNADEVYIATKRHSSQQLCNCLRNNKKSGGTTMVFECTCNLTAKTNKRTNMPG